MTRGGSGAHRAQAAAMTPAHALGGQPSRRRAGSGKIHSILSQIKGESEDKQIHSIPSQIKGESEHSHEIYM